MTTDPSRYRYLGLLGALALPVGLSVAGCTHATAKPQAPAHATGDPCVSMEAVLQGATRSGCTPAQRICLVVGDLPGAVGQPDFVPAAGYSARWQLHVKAWLAQLTEIAKEPALESYAQGAHRKLEQVDASEHDRRLIVENGDLLFALKVLAEKAKTATPPIELGCTLPE